MPSSWERAQHLLTKEPVKDSHSALTCLREPKCSEGVYIRKHDQNNHLAFYDSFAVREWIGSLILWSVLVSNVSAGFKPHLYCQSCWFRMLDQAESHLWEIRNLFWIILLSGYYHLVLYVIHCYAGSEIMFLVITKNQMQMMDTAFSGLSQQYPEDNLQGFISCSVLWNKHKKRFVMSCKAM